tara:strand:+ start:108 stop:527 length:420 start_codon:yes stop_codon:yes gene_type:complete
MVAADQFLTPANLLLFLLLLIVIGVWLQLAMLRIRLSSRLSHIEERLDEQDHLLDLQSKGLADVAATNEKLLFAFDDQRNVLESLRRDSSRLADDVRGEVGMSRAIELARAGADREAVADATGLSLEEAEAIVTFHGKK